MFTVEFQRLRHCPIILRQAEPGVASVAPSSARGRRQVQDHGRARYRPRVARQTQEKQQKVEK